ncbi:hypothetical protein PAF17_03150 [Paracoccus sp. Z330]|uniref:Transposase DDE domain-containing protein n=1 Tax=Paracoccus onchidii TaxID=3017813 RepID=A0ABT4ZAW7_9RHOB|nr:hypothetical protein [Paracoccus onchidii]MDB6176499.1 hypothetical protein [Paracoccus onchidii]
MRQLMAQFDTVAATNGRVCADIDFSLFKGRHRGHIRPMTRMRHIAAASTAPSGALLAVNLRGLLLLTLR